MKVLLADPAAACRGEALGILQLVAFERMRQREPARPAGRSPKLGDGRCARPGDHQMGGGDPLRQIGKKGSCVFTLSRS